MAEYASPICKARRNYKPIVTAVIEAEGEWIRVSLDDIGGATNTLKRTVVHQAAYQHGLEFQTTIVDGFIYVRLRDGAEAP